MSNIKINSKPLLFFVTTLIMSGCGGGSSSDSDTPDTSDTPETSDTPVSENKITAENAKQMASAAFSSVGAAKGLPIRFGVPVDSASNATSGKFNYSDFVTGQLASIQLQNQLANGGAPNAPTATANKSFNCSMDITGEAAEDLVLTVGDTFNITLGACTYDTNLTASGTINTTLTQVEGTFTGSAPYNLGMDTVITNMQVDDGGMVFSSNGDLSMLISVTDSGASTAQMTGHSLSISIGEPGSSSNLLDLTDYQIELIDNSNGDYSVSPQGTVDMKVPFVSVNTSFTTITPFTGNNNIGTGNPTAGELHLIGVDNTQAWVVAQPDGVEIQIKTDIDGDDIVDTTITSSWDEMEFVMNSL